MVDLTDIYINETNRLVQPVERLTASRSGKSQDQTNTEGLKIMTKELSQTPLLQTLRGV